MKGKILGIVLLSLTPLSSFAADGDITFEGIITSSACTLNGFNGGNATTGATMILPMVNPASFLAGGWLCRDD